MTCIGKVKSGIRFPRRLEGVPRSVLHRSSIADLRASPCLFYCMVARLGGRAETAMRQKQTEHPEFKGWRDSQYVTTQGRE